MSTTSKNLNSTQTNNSELIESVTEREGECIPLLLAPVGKDYLWGGVRLLTEFEKEKALINGPFETLAESWECSTHPDGVCGVQNGIYKGKSLLEVLEEHPEFVGTHPKVDSVFSKLPVLIKLIDAKQTLSIQVHPDDCYARNNEGQSGKTEMWYVLDAKPGATLIYGFLHDMDKKEIEESIKQGTIGKHLRKVPVKKDDIFMIWPGTVHAIGEGILLAEIQECSNVTYRLYDYDRTDKNGEKRQLHVKKALEVINCKEQAMVRQKMRLMRYQKGSASESLCRCEYFQVDRVLVTANYHCMIEDTSFQVFLAIDGTLHLEDRRGNNLSVKKGDCVFLPASLGEVTVTGKGQFLKICC